MWINIHCVSAYSSYQFIVACYYCAFLLMSPFYLFPPNKKIMTIFFR